MEIDNKKLNELAKTLTEDQRRLLREGLAGGGELDPETLAKSLHSFDTKAMFAQLTDDSSPVAAPLEFKKAGPATHTPHGGAHIVLEVDRSSLTLAEIEHLAAERSGRALGNITAVYALDLDRSELADATFQRLATNELTDASASERRYVKLVRPSKSTSLADIEGVKQQSSNVARARVVVIVFGPIIIIVVVEDPPPPSEPPLTRW